MTEEIIETRSLNFGFKKNSLILDNINLLVEKGTIYGFLGPNGAGKTTTIRLLFGLLTPISGEIWLFGKSLTKNKPKIFENVGAMIETPSLYEHLSGFDNLDITRRIRNIPKKRINEVLDIVNLSEASKAVVKEYSLGMKQRLGLAVAFLSKPSLLILDEPTNGLDPRGMIEIRELLVKLNRDFRTTILISSHLLSEIEKLVTHLGIINKGKLIFQGAIKELQKLKKGNPVVQIETDNNKRAFNLLKNHYQIITYEENIVQIAFQNQAQIAHIGKTLVNEGLDIYRLQAVANGLEEIFLEITKN